MKEALQYREESVPETERGERGASHHYKRLAYGVPPNENCNQRAAGNYPAQKKHPIDPVQYLAVRLFYEVELVQTFCRREWGIDGTLCALRSYWENHRDEHQNLVGHNSRSVDRHTRAVCDRGWRLPTGHSVRSTTR